MLARLALLCALALALTGSVEARSTSASAPEGLTAFLLRADEPTKHEFNRTPSFAWLPVRGALRYEFELATSRTFTESSLVWSNAADELEEAGSAAKTETKPGEAATPTAADRMKKLYANLRTPAVALDIALPWITGSPYALYAHVRAITKDGPTAWSAPFGFNVRWSSIPRDLDSPHTGLVRWSPVEGATAYQVWLMGARKPFMTTSNVADARDLYTFRQGNPAFTGTISFRVRAQRALYGDVLSGLPTTTWGPWSPTYTDVQSPLSQGELTPVGTVSDVQSDSSADRAHALTPGFVFRGDRGGAFDFMGAGPAELYRVYVATDRDCVNIVFRGALVGSPAYAPRTTGPLVFPSDTKGVDTARASLRGLDHGGDGKALMVDGTVSVDTEAATKAAGGDAAGDATAVVASKVDLPDTAWPSGGYYWTVVPVLVLPRPSDTPPAPNTPIPVEYRETELPQDACQSGRVMRFGKTTPPAITSSDRPFASGLSPTGRLLAAAGAAPRFYGTPLVAWQPVAGAQEYEVQWSKTANPWRPVGSVRTPATSSLLPLDPGTWHYRVRGYNHSLLKRPQMAWSEPSALTVTKPTFAVVRGGR